MIAAVERIGEIDRQRCRASFDQRFTADRMARDYVALYERIIEERVALAGPKIHALGAGLRFEGTMNGSSKGHSQDGPRYMAGGTHA